MSAPNYEQIQSFGNVSTQLKQAAMDEFLEYVHEGMTLGEVTGIATEIASKFSLYGAELGAQWYDLCSELAGLNVDPADIDEVDVETISKRTGAIAESVRSTADAVEMLTSFLEGVVAESIRVTGSSNLWRDYERGMAGGRWCRVPVGDTCAWCLMLASQGAWYLSEKSALGKEPGHYHTKCNCVAVYHANPESIAGYKKLGKYKSMYYEADNYRRANKSWSNDYEYPEELQWRVNAAKEAHIAKFEAGDTDTPWTQYNEDLIVMRYLHPELK